MKAGSNPGFYHLNNQEHIVDQDQQFNQGLEMRKRVMGEAFVDKAFANVDAFTEPLQAFVTRNAWGTSWCREGTGSQDAQPDYPLDADGAGAGD